MCLSRRRQEGPNALQLQYAYPGLIFTSFVTHWKHFKLSVEATVAVTAETVPLPLLSATLKAESAPVS